MGNNADKTKENNQSFNNSGGKDSNANNDEGNPTPTSPGKSYAKNNTDKKSAAKDITDRENFVSPPQREPRVSATK